MRSELLLNQQPEPLRSQEQPQMHLLLLDKLKHRHLAQQLLHLQQHQTPFKLQLRPEQLLVPVEPQHLQLNPQQVLLQMHLQHQRLSHLAHLPSQQQDKLLVQPEQRHLLVKPLLQQLEQQVHSVKPLQLPPQEQQEHSVRPQQQLQELQQQRDRLPQKRHRELNPLHHVQQLLMPLPLHQHLDLQEQVR